MKYEVLGGLSEEKVYGEVSEKELRRLHRTAEIYLGYEEKNYQTTSVRERVIACYKVLGLEVIGDECEDDNVTASDEEDEDDKMDCSDDGVVEEEEQEGEQEAEEAGEPEDQHQEFDLSEDDDDDLISTYRDPVSKHYEPVKQCKTPKDLLLAGVEYVRSRHKSQASMSERSQYVDFYLQNTSAELVKVLQSQSSETAKIVLDAIVKGEFTKRRTVDKIKAVHKDNASESNDAGLYIIFIVDKTGVCRKYYLGLSTNLGRRTKDHRSPVDSIYLESEFDDLNIPSQRGNLLFEAINEAKQAGHEVLVRVMTRVPKQHIFLLLVWEPVWAAVLGSYQQKDKYLKLRALKGLPCISVVGLNGSECFDGNPTQLKKCLPKEEEEEELSE